MTRPTFQAVDSAFRAALKARVAAYFKAQGTSPHGDARMVVKTVIFFTAFAGLLTVLMTGALPLGLALVACVLLGMVVAFIGFNVAHDAVHGAYSANRTVNRVLGAWFDVLGASSYNWSRAHNMVHHTFTNVPGTDHDLEPGPFLLLHQRSSPPFIYRFQHLFAFPLYAFTLLVWVFKKDFVQIADRTMTGAGASKRGALSMVAGKLLHFSVFLALPMLVSPYAWWKVLIAYGVVLAVAGFTLAVVFQLAHVVEGTAFPKPSASNALNDGWASHQLRTTANFSQGSWAAAFFLGGLNNQIEHHLLPGVCHIHYAALAPLVRQVAAEHGLPYLDSGDFFQALAAHVRTLYRFGRPVTPAPA